LVATVVYFVCNINELDIGGTMQPKFVEVDRETLYLLPPSIQDWLPAGHLARFVVEIVEQLDLCSLKASYAGRGSQPYNPEMLVALLFYGYATGVFSSRKLERNTYDSVSFRYITANSHPDHDTIAISGGGFCRN
jgi:transposase